MAVDRLDLSGGMSLDFGAPDEETFPAIGWLGPLGAKGDVATCALNAANEVAVRSFLKGDLPFRGISQVVKRVVETSEGGSFGTYAEVVAVDEQARDAAIAACAELANARMDCGD